MTTKPKPKNSTSNHEFPIPKSTDKQKNVDKFKSKPKFI